MQEQTKLEKFLPIGTIVLLKNGKKEVMILSYGLMPQGTVYEGDKKISGIGKIYDYGGCTYTEGLISSEQILGCNHEQIQKICYPGYSTPIHDEYNKFLKESFEQVKEEISKMKPTEEENQA